MTYSSAYLLVVHGSSDRRYQIAIEQLSASVRQQLEKRTAQTELWQKYKLKQQCQTREKLGTATALLSKPQSPLVATASLELATVPLRERIGQFALRVQAAGLRRLSILPLFLLPGVHVREDIPTEIALARQLLGDRLTLELLPYLGSNPSLVKLVAKQFEQLPARGRILLSHGSRRRGGNQTCQAIASELQAHPAYCSISPSLTEQVEALAAAGKQEIAIVPYFLFSGGITKAIAEQVGQLQIAFPNLRLLLGKPLSSTSELATSIVQGIR